MPGDSDFATETGIILNKEEFQVSFMPGELPGSKKDAGDTDPLSAAFGGAMATPPIKPTTAMRAVLSNGELAAVLHAVAEGTAGVRYVIVPKFRGETEDTDLSDPKNWPDGAQEQRDKLQIFIQAGFQGRGAKSLRDGFRDQEHDRAMLGWGGVTVFRQNFMDRGRNMPPSPRALGRFEAFAARFSKPQRNPTLTPVPIALEDGRVVWIEEARHFRRIRVQTGRRVFWFKEFGDWRAMSTLTGKYGRGSRRIAPTVALQPGRYVPGRLKRGDVLATEVMHWETSFPGAYPYGISGWHSELTSAASASESTKLLLSHLRSGLHSVILAAANRPFEHETAQAAINKIDELGRGRKGMGSLILMSLVPADSEIQRSGGNPFDTNTSLDRGKLVLHELNTKLPAEVMDGSLTAGLGKRFAHSERIPALLLGKSDSYNFATASAAWAVVNRLRFNPHHEERMIFLNRLLVDMEITLWAVTVISPEWDEKEPVSGVASVAGANAGLSANKAMQMLGEVLDMPVMLVKEWWGDVPFSIVKAVLESDDPVTTLNLLGMTDVAKQFEEDSGGEVGKPIMDMLNDLEKRVRELAGDDDDAPPQDDQETETDSS